MGKGSQGAVNREGEGFPEKSTGDHIALHAQLYFNILCRPLLGKAG